VVDAMEAGTREVESGSRPAIQDGPWEEIPRVVEQAARVVQSISTAAGQLRTNAEQVVQAFDSVAAFT